MSRIDRDSPDPRLITHALEKLRARDGLTAARLLSGQTGDAQALLTLGAVRRYADTYSLDLPRAAVEVIKECVQENLPPSFRIVADAVLGLGVFAEMYAIYGLDQRVVKALSSDLLGRRRTALLHYWRELHEAVGQAAPDVPSDRSLRGIVEPDMLAALAEQLIRREVFSFGAKNASVPASTVRAVPSRSRGNIIVVGGAAMDAKFRTSSLPTVGTSNEALSFDLAPGGKGLNQAVAAARLGLDVSLVAAVSNDRFGDEIVKHLEDHGVDTSLLKRVDSRTPFTAVIEFELGDSLALNWRNRRYVRLEP